MTDNEVTEKTYIMIGALNRLGAIREMLTDILPKAAELNADRYHDFIVWLDYEIQGLYDKIEVKE